MASAADSGAPATGPSGPPKTPGQSDAPLPPVPINVGAGAQLSSASKEQVQHVLSSDIGITTLLSRLKQSIASTRDFAGFLKERASLEERHAHGMKRLTRSTLDQIRRPESRQGSFAQNYEEFTRTHDRMADHGSQFSTAILQMSEELYELAANSDKERKHWKQTGLSAEKRVQDAENAMEKAKSKYNSLAEQFDRARTGERQPGKLAGFKKSAAQQEEDLQRKVEAADGDYAHKVQVAQTMQNELVTVLRPQTVAALQDLIKETDAGLTVQMQRFAAQTEKLLLGYGLTVTPIKGQQSGGTTRSLRDVAASINNDKDFVDFVLQFTHKAGIRGDNIRYEQHPSLSPKQAQPSSSSFGPPRPDPYGNYNPANHGRQISGVTPYQGDEHEERSTHQGPGPNYGGPYPGPPGQQSSYGPPSNQPGTRLSASGAPQLPQLDSISGDRFIDNTSGGDLAPLHTRNASQPPSGAQGDGLSSFPRPAPSQGPSNGPVQSGPPNSEPNRPPRAGSLGQQGSFPSSGPTSPQGMGARPSNLGQSAQMPGQSESHVGGFGGPQMGQPGAPQSSMGQGQSSPGPSPGPGYNPALRTTGPGSGPQQGMPPQGREGPGSPSLQSGPNGGPRPGPSMNGGPQNGPPWPTQGSSNGAGRGQYAGSGGSINALPSRQNGLMAGPPVKPVFGVSLDNLFQRDGTAVPTIVYQCVQAVDLYGLEVEGIYRTSGSAHHIMELRRLFDQDASAIDFRNATSFYNDIASVTTLLKHFLRDLPDPLLTAEQYQAFIEAAKLEDDIVRRDSIHALVNSLPDPNYATLRTLVLHLHRVAAHSDKNKMTQSNLAIVFAPTLMGRAGGANGQAPGAGSDIADAGWQAKVVETILNNTFQIFDDDE
ncbi:hypothetical protein PV08_05383 [Exophiala spinifera]|uniref:Rho-GAP domain-containing protein n=1 Tax=Exophiala spinifera TaxID=91928 RepID=A0A0D1ZRA5_9EURO|nr:uncharacterized protein PV08_05383 [Exophiala spinifera]KIW15337.1 hypothetical protein PV08_05383 [Exophiala spinifera]